MQLKGCTKDYEAVEVLVHIPFWLCPQPLPTTEWSRAKPEHKSHPKEILFRKCAPTQPEVDGVAARDQMPFHRWKWQTNGRALGGRTTICCKPGGTPVACQHVPAVRQGCDTDKSVLCPPDA